MSNTTVRSGWNTRGGTAKEHLRLERELDNHWKYMAETECEKMADMLEDDYPVWMELTFPHDAIETYTYQQIYDLVHAAINSPDAVYADLICTCNGVISPCRLCQAQARLPFYEDELPY